MTRSYTSGEQLARAFPLAIRADVQVATFRFPVTRLLGENFSVRVGDEALTLPDRIHNDPALIPLAQLTDLQREFIDCLLTRHTDGFVREQHLARIIRSRKCLDSSFRYPACWRIRDRDPSGRKTEPCEFGRVHLWKLLNAQTRISLQQPRDASSAIGTVITASTNAMNTSVSSCWSFSNLL